MEKSNNLKKIMDIFNFYKGNIEEGIVQESAKTWEIGTDIFQTWKLMIEKSNKAIENKNKKPLKFLIKYINPFKERYSFIMNVNDNITPSKRLDEVAFSTIRQYIQIGYSLGLLNTEKIVNSNDIIVNINPKFWQINPQNIESELIDLFLITLLNSTTSIIDYQRNLGISIFLSLIDTYDETIFDKLDNDFCLRPRTARNKYLNDSIIYLNTTNGKQFIKHIKGVDTDIYGKGKKTYVDLCEKMLSKYSFENIISLLHDTINGLPINVDGILSKNIANDRRKKDLLFKYNKKISCARGLLRENIQCERVKTKDDILYSDLENSENNYTYVQSQEACHIYDIKKIKMDLKNYISDNEYEEIDETILDEMVALSLDYNNGILMNPMCHSFFDKNYVWFDSEGKLHYLQEQKEKIKKAFGDNLDTIKIKKETLSHEMKKYLCARNNYNFK